MSPIDQRVDNFEDLTTWPTTSGWEKHHDNCGAGGEIRKGNFSFFTIQLELIYINNHPTPKGGCQQNHFFRQATENIRYKIYKVRNATVLGWWWQEYKTDNILYSKQGGGTWISKCKKGGNMTTPFVLGVEWMKNLVKKFYV
jgi:hypothetical protein